IALGRALKQIREDRKRARDADNLENGTNRQGPEFDADEKDEIQVILAHVQNEAYLAANGDIALLPTVAELRALYGTPDGILTAIGVNAHHLMPEAKLARIYWLLNERHLGPDELDSMPGFLLPRYRHQGIAGTGSGFHQIEEEIEGLVRSRVGRVPPPGGGFTITEEFEIIRLTYDAMDDRFGAMDGVDYRRLRDTMINSMENAFDIDTTNGVSYLEGP
ncbi:MAG: hypothetical protein AAFQ71_02750, partial [Planctomycetota bacterium]